MILDDESAAIAETVRARAWDRLEPHAAEIDRTQAFSKLVWEELRSMGIFGLPFAPEAGGAGASTLAYIVALEQVAYSCAVAALYPGTTVQVAQALLAHAPEPVAARWVPRLVAGEVPAAWAFTEPQTGSDPRQLTTRARRDGDGWILDGQKMFISYAAEAAVALVFAVTEEQQVCAFVVDTAQPGWTTGPAAEVMAFGGTVSIAAFASGPLVEIWSVTAVMLGGAVVAVALIPFADVRDRSVAAQE